MCLLRDILFTFSLLLLAGELSLWIAGRGGMSVAVLALPPDGRTQFIASHDHGLYVGITGYILDDRSRFFADATTDNWDKATELLTSLQPFATHDGSIGPVHILSGSTSAGAPARWWLLRVNHLFPLALLSLWPALRLRRILRRRWWRRHGRCHLCGYDLRGTAAGCPECGAGRHPPASVPV